MKDKKVTTEGAASENLDCGKQESENLSVKLTQIVEFAEKNKGRDSRWVQVQYSAQAMLGGKNSGPYMKQLMRALEECVEPAATGFIEGLKSLPGKDEKTTSPLNGDGNEKMQFIKAVIDRDSAYGGKTGFMDIDKFSPHPLAKKIFKIEEEVLDAVFENIKEHGYDYSKPLSVVRGPDDKPLIVEGQTRYAAACKAGVKFLPCILMNFKSDDEMLEYVIHNQIIKRPNSDPVILKAAETLIPIEERLAKERQGKTGTSTQEWAKGGSSKAVGLILDRSKSTVDKIKAVLKHEDIKAKVFAGELSINRAYEELSEARREKLEVSRTPVLNEGESSGEESEGNGPSATMKAKVGVADEETPVIPGKAANRPKVESKTQDISVPQNILTLLVRYFPEEHIGELEEHLKSCDPELVRLITSMIVGTKAA